MMNNTTIYQQGEQLSFYQLFAKKKWKIEIPIIQRDYAQGRESEREVRGDFLDALHNYLTDEPEVSKDLDFIYGSINKPNDCFIPLDGQQRLTTLFLLHWYLANLENKQNKFHDFMMSQDENANSKSNFTYATRASAREFCNSLVSCNVNLNNLLDDKLSTTLKNLSWYFELWENDSTVKAMLIMLDAIHETFKCDAENALFDKLCDNDSPAITFQFLNIETHGLTDDLYIKMNSRGKLLEDFENFKAKLEQHIKQFKDNLPKYQLHNQQQTADKYFSHKIDTTWADLFWKYRIDGTATFDKEIMNFIKLIIACDYISEKTGSQYSSFFYLGDMRDFSFNIYKKMNCLNESLIKYMVSIFDLLAGESGNIKLYLKDKYYFNEEDTFKKIIRGSTSYPEKLRFYAFYKYLIKYEPGEGLDNWMRVIL